MFEKSISPSQKGRANFSLFISTLINSSQLQVDQKSSMLSNTFNGFQVECRGVKGRKTAIFMYFIQIIMALINKHSFVNIYVLMQNDISLPIDRVRLLRQMVFVIIVSFL